MNRQIDQIINGGMNEQTDGQKQRKMDLVKLINEWTNGRTVKPMDG